MALAFDAASHRYTLDGVVLPSVTQVIRDAGLMPAYYSEDAEWYADRGSAVHEATALYDRGILDDASLDQEIVGYVESYRAFRRDSEKDLRIVDIEVPLASLGMFLAGTPDRLILWRGRGTVLEIKTGSAEPWHRLQVAGYMALAESIEGLVVYLDGEGGWKFGRSIDRADRIAFASVLAIQNWKRANGLA